MWTKEEDEKLAVLAKSGDYFYAEIAVKLGRNAAAVRWRAKKLGLPAKVSRIAVGGWNKKYGDELVEKVIQYYLKHSHKQCAVKFDLTEKQIKSLLTNAYKNQYQRKFRTRFLKETRRRDKWTQEQIREMLKCIGLLPRKEIAKRIGRDNERVIKEKLQHVGTKYPKYLNGLTLSKFRDRFECEPDVMILTKAGPGRGKHSATFFKIVPWVWIEDAIEIGHIQAASALRKWVHAMADFQRHIHGKDVYRSLGNIIPFEQWEVR